MSSKCGSIIIMLVDFSYHLQIHDWGLISFYLKEEKMHGISFWNSQKLTFS